MANNIATYEERVFGKEGRSYLMGIAILWIIFFHFYCWFNGTKPWWLYFLSEGQTGVDIFLFLSAYGLEASLSKNNWKRFYLNRAKRILPVYFLFLLTVFGIFQNHIPFRSIIIQCIGQLTGFSLFQSEDFFSTNFEFDWFSPALIMLYLLYPFISNGLSHLSKQEIKWEIITLLLLVFISLYDLRSIQLPIKHLIYRLPIFMLGAITCIHIKNENINRLLILYAVFFICGAFSNQHWFIMSSSIPIFLTTYAMIEGRRPLFKAISELGHHSYEIYLAHIFPVTNFLKLMVFENIYIYILVTIVWTIIIATLYSLFQKYSNKILTLCNI